MPLPVLFQGCLPQLDVCAVADLLVMMFQGRGCILTARGIVDYLVLPSGFLEHGRRCCSTKRTFSKAQRVSLFVRVKRVAQGCLVAAADNH